MRSNRNFRLCKNLMLGNFYITGTAILSSKPPLWSNFIHTVVFSDDIKKKQRQQAALQRSSSKLTDYIRRDVADNIAERLLVSGVHFLGSIGSGPGYVAQSFRHHNEKTEADRQKVDDFILCDTVEAQLNRDVDTLPSGSRISRRLIASMEKLHEIESNSVDAVVSSLCMQWINDLPSTLRELERVLKPDGCVIAAVLGNDTLFELRSSLLLAEQERDGSLYPHISPMIGKCEHNLKQALLISGVADVSALLSRADFQLITLDTNTIQVDYPSTFALMSDLRASGDSNAIFNRHFGPLPRDILISTDAIYRQTYPGEKGGIVASFDIGWKLGPGQKQPSKPGSAQYKLKDVI